MLNVINSMSVIGTSHKKKGIVCQDKSISIELKDMFICGVSDGHGGAVYFRSDLGAEYALDSVVEVFKKYRLKKYLFSSFYKFFNKKIRKDDFFVEKLKKEILEKWNEKCKKNFEENPFNKDDRFLKLTEDDKCYLGKHFIDAYGCTLLFSVVYKNIKLIFQIGDGNITMIDSNGVLKELDVLNSKLCHDNITTSLCEEDAIDNFKALKLIDDDSYAIIMCTDGIINSFKNKDYFLDYMPQLLTDYKYPERNDDNSLDGLEYVTSTGSGDDVSYAFWMNNDVFEKYPDLFKVEE